MFSFIFSLIYAIDLFKTPFLLRFKNRKKSYTYLGSFLSLVVLSAVLVSFFQSDMIHKKGPKVIEKILSTYSVANADSANSPSITIDGNFSLDPFAFGLSDYARNIYKDPTIFSIDTYATLQNGTIFFYNPLTVKPCEQSDTPLKSFNNTLGNVSCVPKGSEFTIQGGSQDDVFQSVGFALRVCNPYTDNVTCKSAKEIETFFLDKFFFLFYPDHTYDVDNYEHPINDEYLFKYTRVSITQSNFLLHYYQKASFLSDDNWLYSDFKEKVVFNKDYDESNSQQLADGQFMLMNVYERPLIMYYFGTTKSIHSITRSYQKLQEALANVAGISNTLIFIGFILTGFQSRMSMVSKIIKLLYVPKKTKKNNKTDKNINDKKKSLDIKVDDSKIFIESPSPQKNEIQANITINPPEKDMEKEGLKPEPAISPTKRKELALEMSEDISSSRVQTEKDEVAWMLNSKAKISDSQGLIKRIEVDKCNEKTLKFQKFCKKNQNKSRGLKITSYRYIRAQMKNILRRNLSDDEKLILMGEKIYNKEIDIVTILLRLQDIEKLKKIILTQEQLVLFELIDKPRIYPDEEEILVNIDNMKESSLSKFSPKKKYEDNMMDSVRIYDKIIRKQEKTKIELRLLDMLDEDAEDFDQGG